MDKIVMVKVADIKPYEKNPRFNDATVKKLVNIIPKVGFNVPLLLDKNNVIVKGHARYRAALELKMDEVPCIYTDNSDELNKFDRIADNKVHEFTVWDDEQLAHEVDMIDTDYDMSDLGVKAFTAESFDGFGFDDQEEYDGAGETDDEEKKRKFLEYLKEKENEIPTAPVITTQLEIDNAQEKAKKVTSDIEMVKVVCEECGLEYYVRKGKTFKF